MTARCPIGPFPTRASARVGSRPPRGGSWLGPLVSAAGMYLAAACSGEAPPDRDAVTRDSAGVHIVENRRANWDGRAPWTIAPAPMLLVGGVDAPPEAQFHRVRGVVRLGNGNLVIADGGTQELRFFSSAGEHLRTVGRRGSGPGEFRNMTRPMLLPGDTIVVHDETLWRVTVLSPDGTIARTVPLEPVAASLELVAPLPDGRFLLATRSAAVPDRRADGVYRYPRLYVRYAGDGSSVDTVLSVPGLEFEIRFIERIRSHGAAAVPFSRDAVDAHAYGRWITADNGRFELHERDQDGRVVRIVRYPPAERPMTDSVAEALEGELIRELENPTQAQVAGIRRTIRELARPDRVPVLSSLSVDPEGFVWVGEWRSPVSARARSPRFYWVVDRSGRLLGTVGAPGNFTLFGVGPSLVFGVQEDELGVQRLAVYPMSRE